MTYPRILILFFLSLAAFTADAQISLGKTEVGSASFYSSRFEGRKTSFGETHQSTELSAAHRSLPLNTMLEITNLSNNQKVIVRVNDRGPFSHNRIVDISKEAARLIGIVSSGVAKVSMRIVGMEGMIMLDSNEDIDHKVGKIISMRTKD
jgi:rare lipoprotein A